MIATTFSQIRSLEEKHTGVATETISLRSFVAFKRNYFFFKRIADIIISLFIIVFFLSWFLPLAALLIKLDSPGPVFFIQRRVGRWGRSFPCFKFRTMFVNENAHTEQAKENDSRITRMGNFLRNTNLDEFPQFFNVLLGHMSVVGPRPHMHTDCNAFAAAVNGYKLRNLVRPGVTGLAQVKGYRGPTNDFESIFHRYQFDAFYVRNAGFWLDMRIVRKTAAQTIRQIFYRVFRNRNQAEVIDPITTEWVTPAASLKSIQN
jgi:putative colanic acid biosysnthesis UDP-glucose lipid carrier transferase